MNLFFQATGGCSAESRVLLPAAPLYYRSPSQAAAGAVLPDFGESRADDASIAPPSSESGSVFTPTGVTGAFRSAASSSVASVHAPDGFLATGNWYMQPHLKARARHRLARSVFQQQQQRAREKRTR